MQTVEGTDLSFGIGATPDEQSAALAAAKKTTASKEPPEWLRKIIGAGGHGLDW